MTVLYFLSHLSDAMLTSFINCATSFLSGFVVFSVLGHMCNRMNKSMEEVANEGNSMDNLASPNIIGHQAKYLNSTHRPGLVFIAYPEAIATLKGSTFWAIIFMLMLITLGLDSTFGGLEAIITAVLDKIPSLRRRREVFVLIIIIYCFTGALATTTCGGYLILTLLDTHGAPISILFIVFCECVALCWFYGTKRFCADIRMMLGFTPGKFWQICWTFISPLFLLVSSA
ncbi:solute carrier family 6 (neurotransmitter transporter, serotonin) member 4 [Paragonimus westermani]|uniref:Solute carrier family 6 (Neurotransmitter transporter, serotonin) member 4 n=1 Tax=Paragonimus westermani TaxID=34504 RepID=A0A5J4NTB6_9TREM|nr:solute carrier family 6 (neurotransmitter transporter, serotonin) member 4 [Paragonimus westermani]